jgi:hypothetical protein
MALLNTPTEQNKTSRCHEYYLNDMSEKAGTFPELREIQERNVTCGNKG